MEMWKAATHIQERMKKLVATNHPDLVPVVDQIVIMFRQNCQRSGGRKVLGKAMRSNSYINALAEFNYEFIIVLGHEDGWEELSHTKQQACIDHYLCACRCEEDTDEVGNTIYKCRNVPPTIQAFPDNVKRYGMWFPEDEDGEDTPETTDPTAPTGSHIVLDSLT